VQEWNKETNLEHVHELMVESLSKHTEIVAFTVQNLKFMLIDKERDCHSVPLDLLKLTRLSSIIRGIKISSWINTTQLKQRLFNLEKLLHILIKVSPETFFLRELKCHVLKQRNSQQIVR
jgi:hypothetical protein